MKAGASYAEIQNFLIKDSFWVLTFNSRCQITFIALFMNLLNPFWDCSHFEAFPGSFNKFFFGFLENSIVAVKIVYSINVAMVS